MDFNISENTLDIPECVVRGVRVGANDFEK